MPGTLKVLYEYGPRHLMLQLDKLLLRCNYNTCIICKYIRHIVNNLIYRIPPFKRPRGVTFCKKSAKRLHIILSVSAWKKIILGA